jgi:outer membrane receptor protein involved in Fe transport
MTRKYLLLSAVATAAAITTSVSAQDAGAELEEIVVTGSYLFTGIDSPSPVQVISGDELVTTAPADLATYFFDNVPQNVSPQPIAETSNAGMQRDRAIRTASIDLRGIGPENTLVLLNGRRTIPNSAPDFSGFRRTDINSLVPRIAIARTELLLDGGSALYGSDAVAGVINTVTRDDFEGFDFSLDSRFFQEDTSAKDYTIAAIWGAGNATSHVIAAVEWHETDRLLIDVASGDFENNPNVDPLAGTGLQEQGYLEFAGSGRRASSWIDPDCGNPAFGVPVRSYYPAYQDPADDLVYLSANPHTGADGTGSAPLTAAEICAQPQGFSPENIIQNDVEQLMAFIAGSHRLGDSLTAKVELNFNRQRFNDTETWGTRSGGTWVPTTPAGFGFSIPVTHPGRIAGVATAAATGQPAFGTSMGMSQTIYSPGETIAFLDTMTAFQESDIWRAAFSLEGDINADWSWSIHASAAYNTVRNSIRDIVTARYEPAINGLGGPRCSPTLPGDPSDPANDSDRGVGDCHYFNMFMSSALPNATALGLANDQQMLEDLMPLRTDIFAGEFYNIDFQATGFFGDLPGGPIGLAVGTGVRMDRLERNSDQLGNSGETATLGTVTDWGGRQSVTNAYVEMALPVTDTVNVQLAARYEDYDGFTQVSPKIAALWNATDDLVVRASWGQSFKAPGIVHLASESIFNGAGSMRVTVSGVAYGTPGRGPVRGSYQISANPDLTAQTSDNFSVGFDYNVTDNISVGLAYVGIDFTDRIVNPNMPSILGREGCYRVDASGIPITADASNADPNGTPTAALTYEDSGPNACVILKPGATDNTHASVAMLYAQPINAQFLNVEAIDLRANMFWDTGIGMVTFTPNISVFTAYEYPGADTQAQCPDGVCDGVGRTTPRGSSGITQIPRWSGTFAAGLGRGDQSLRLTARYTDGVNPEIEDLTPESKLTFEHTDGLWTLDVNWRWQFSARSSVSASVRNIFAEDPPTRGGAIFNRNRRTFSVQYLHSFAN